MTPYGMTYVGWMMKEPVATGFEYPSVEAMVNSIDLNGDGITDDVMPIRMEGMESVQVPEEYDFCRWVEWHVDQGGDSVGYMADNDGNYELEFPDRNFSDVTWLGSEGTDVGGAKILLTWCSRGQGQLSLQDGMLDENKDSECIVGRPPKHRHCLRSKAYTVGYSRLAQQIDDAPGGHVAAQLLVTLIATLLFWVASGPLLGGGRTGGSSMQPFGGLVGMVLGALVLPIFGFGDWIFAIALVTVAVLFGFLYAALISGKT